ncbi:hypothetical protein [uncultured Campylobacter sp.]|uniref:hypothetical protein n=1 Tax=uncultured Campylobacter sp. TaxID=218934 RepID=UPI00261A8B6B|nr:hypothetical protein [uncultured Campylobacter sp.]
MISTSTAADFGLKFKGLGADRVAEFTTQNLRQNFTRRNSAMQILPSKISRRKILRYKFAGQNFTA